MKKISPIMMMHAERLNSLRPIAENLDMEFDELYMLYHIMEIADYRNTISRPMSDPGFYSHIGAENVDYLLDDFLKFPQHEEPREYARRFMTNKEYREEKIKQWEDNFKSSLRSTAN